MLKKKTKLNLALGKLRFWVFGECWFPKGAFEHCMCGSYIGEGWGCGGEHNPVEPAYYYYRPNILERMFPRLRRGPLILDE